MPPFVFNQPEGTLDGIHYHAIRSGTPETLIQKSSSISLPILIRSTTNEPINIEFISTYGHDWNSDLFPPGILGSIDPPSIVLEEKQETLINLELNVN